jgi:hypothetical protein
VTSAPTRPWLLSAVRNEAVYLEALISERDELIFTKRFPPKALDSPREDVGISLLACKIFDLKSSICASLALVNG